MHPRGGLRHAARARDCNEGAQLAQTQALE